MAGVATVTGYIREDLNRGTDYDARIRRALLSAMQFYRARRFAFNQKRTSMLVSAEFFSLTADWIMVDSLRVGHGNSYYSLEKRNWGWIEGRTSSNNGTGPPVAYAVQGRQLRLYPIPDQTYSFAMTYVYDLVAGITSLSDSQSTAWLGEAQEMIRMHAMADILTVYRRSAEDSSKAVELSNRELVLYNSLRQRASEEVASGRIDPFM
jgi:hypothetical protein